jgi:drug/metabolite transporter (DMT)-like permease
MAVIITGIITSSFDIRRGTVKALFLSLLVGLFIGAYTCLDRMALEYAHMNTILFWKFLAAGIVLLMVHSGREDFGRSVRANLGMSFLAGVFILSAYFLVVYAMKYSNLGYVAVGREIGIAFAVVLSIIFLKEKMDLRRIAGAFLIFSGIVLLRFA